MTPVDRDAARRVVALLSRTSDAHRASMEGTRALGRVLEAREVGSVSEPRAAPWEEDLRDSRGPLLEAGGQVADALADDVVPVLLAGSCSVCLTTLPVLARERPDAWVLWLDAHGDFHTPQTTPSGFLGGMCLAAACGLWDSGLGAGLDPARVVMFGVRDLEGPEQVALTTHGVGLVQRAGDLPDLLDGRQLFVHLDLDVLDPSVLPADYPAPGGLSFDRLRRVLEDVGEAADVVGVEVTSAHPDHADATAAALAPLL